MAAIQWQEQNREPLVITDYIVDEVLTLLKAKVGAQAAIEAGDALWHEDLSRLVFLIPG